MEIFKNISTAIEQNNLDKVRQIIQEGFDVNNPDEDGAPVLFYAIMQGNLDIIRFLLEQGADPNFIAEEPAASIYTERPLDLARQLRFIMDWDKYHPVVRLLNEFKATDLYGQIDDLLETDDLEQKARQWQAQKST